MEYVLSTQFVTYTPVSQLGGGIDKSDWINFIESSNRIHFSVLESTRRIHCLRFAQLSLLLMLLLAWGCISSLSTL